MCSRHVHVHTCRVTISVNTRSLPILSLSLSLSHSTTTARVSEMGSSAIAGDEKLQTAFEDLDKRRALLANCTLLWKELTDHFASLEQDLQHKSEALKSKYEALDLQTKKTLEILQKREFSIDEKEDASLARVDQQREAALTAFEKGSDGGAEGTDGPDQVMGFKLRSYCRKMDSRGFWRFITSSKKDIDVLRSQIPLALSDCIDPAKFVLSAIGEIFPVDKRVNKVSEQGWASILLLESLVPVLADPLLGDAHPMVTPNVREMAKEIADTWKADLDKRGGVENAKSPEAHTFLQHLVTFGIASKDDGEFYRKLVSAFSWRKQMPKLAISVGLADKMADIIGELISKRKQIDAVHFIYEMGLIEKFPPVPLLKSYLKSSRDEAASILKTGNNSIQAAQEAGRKEQAAHRAVIKCVEEHELETEFPLENLHKRVAQLEKAKVDRKKSASAANKRTRASNGGPLPPAKAGRLTNNAYAGSGLVRSPSSQTQYPAPPLYNYDRRALVAAYGSQSQSPPALPNPYAYPVENGTGGIASYNYGGYGNGLPPVYQQPAYYR